MRITILRTERADNENKSFDCYIYRQAQDVIVKRELKNIFQSEIKDHRQIELLRMGLPGASQTLTREKDSFKLQCVFFYYELINKTPNYWLYRAHPKPKERIEQDKDIILNLLF